MKREEHIQEAKAIGDDSYALIHYDQLPLNASIIRQVEALEADKKWQELHRVEVEGRIDALIATLRLTERRR